MLQHTNLLSPGAIGTMELRNRIVMCPMGDNLAGADGHVTPEQIAYFEARAKGGVGLVLVGSVSVTWPDGAYNPFQTAISDDRFLPGLRSLTERVHAHGARIAAQLSHGGKGAVEDMGAGRPLLVPSKPARSQPDPLMGMVTAEEGAAMGEPFQRPTTRVEHHVMTEDDIAAMVASYADAVERAQRAGFDGVEIHAGHGYLIDQFLSPASNTREDAYGGSLENRARFLLEVLAAARARVGRDFPLWCRINGEERLTEGGTTLADAVATAKLCEQAGVDALHVSAYADPGRAIGCTVSHTTDTPGSLVELAATIRKNVHVPVITVGRIEPDVADALIAEGKADFVAMGRKLLADPELPNKLAAHHPEDVKPCVYHYRCIGQIFLRRGVRCAVNPTTGRELELGATTGRRQRLAVIGGGPAGLEAARLAAVQGHEVVLYERSRELGGLLRAAALDQPSLGRLLDWLLVQVAKLPIDVRLATEASATSWWDDQFDAAIVATGATWTRPDVDGAGGAHVHTLPELAPLLLAGASLGAHAVVLGGGTPGLGAARALRARGLAVTVLDEGRCFAPQLGLPGRWQLVSDLREDGVQLVDRATLTGVADDTVSWVDRAGDTHAARADLVVAAAGAVTGSALGAELGSRVRVEHVGDCADANFVEGAMSGAAEAVVSLFAGKE